MLKRFWPQKMFKGRFHRPGLTPQLANPRLRDNRGLSPACVPSLSVNLTNMRPDLVLLSCVCNLLSRSRVNVLRSH